MDKSKMDTTDDQGAPLKWHQRFTVAQRIWALVALMVLAVLATATMHMRTITELDAIAEFEGDAQHSMETLDTLWGDLRWQYALARDVESGKPLPPSYHELYAGIEKGFETLKGRVPEILDDDRVMSALVAMQRQSSDIHKDVLKMDENVRRIGITENQGLRGKAREAIHALEAKVRKLGDERLLAEMLMLRRHEKDFLLRLNEQYLHKHKNQMRRMRALTEAAHIPPRDRKEMRLMLESYNKSFGELATLRLANRDLLHAISTRFEAIGKEYHGVDTAIGEVLRDLNMREQGMHEGQNYLFWAGILLLLGIVVGLGAMIARSIVRPLGKIGEAMDALDDGDVSHTLDVRMAGVIGQLAVAYNKLKRTVEEAFILRSVVDRNPQAIMLADLGSLDVTYMNGAAVELFRQIESALPCRADEIVGKNIDIFHKNPAHQRAILSDPSNLPYHASFTVAGRHIEFDAVPIRDAKGQLTHVMVSWNDVTQRVEMAEDFEERIGRMVNEIIEAGQRMTETSEKMSAMAEQSAAQAGSVQMSAEDASQNVVTVASAAEELSASIAEITRQVREAVEISREAVEEARRTDATVAKLSEASEQIGEVVRVITDIAEQTNLLALNASIEAARAGDAGRGFAVVAGEVKELANQTAQATEQIAERIEQIQCESKGAANAIRHIGEVIERMNEINQAIATATEEQNEATREIARSVQMASDSTHQAVEEIAGVAQAAEQTGQSAGEVLEVSSNLRSKGDELSQRVKDFLAGLLREGKSEKA